MARHRLREGLPELGIPASGTLFRNAAGASSSRYAWRDMWGSTFPVTRPYIRVKTMGTMASPKLCFRVELLVRGVFEALLQESSDFLLSGRFIH